MNAPLPLETLDQAIESIRKVEVYAELISAAAVSEIACSEAISEGARAICEETGRLRGIISRNGAARQRQQG